MPPRSIQRSRCAGNKTTARAALLVVCLTAGLVLCGCRDNTPRAGFWFDEVTFELPGRETSRLGGRIRDEEKTRIQQIARDELIGAYTGLRISVTDDPRAFYRVSVVQDLHDRPHGTRSPIGGVAGESRSLGPLGGQGAVSFLILATNAVYYAPPDADRAAIISGMGRGLGRAAAHELAHQIIGGTVDATRDRSSYEYSNADRAEQYYGTLHWNGAWNALLKKLGPPASSRRSRADRTSVPVLHTVNVR